MPMDANTYTYNVQLTHNQVLDIITGLRNHAQNVISQDPKDTTKEYVQKAYLDVADMLVKVAFPNR